MRFRQSLETRENYTIRKSQVEKDYADLRLQIKNECQNMKTLEGTGPENLNEPKFIG